MSKSRDTATLRSAACRARSGSSRLRRIREVDALLDDEPATDDQSQELLRRGIVEPVVDDEPDEHTIS